MSAFRNNVEVDFSVNDPLEALIRKAVPVKNAPTKKVKLVTSVDAKDQPKVTPKIAVSVLSGNNGSRGNSDANGIVAAVSEAKKSSGNNRREQENKLQFETKTSNAAFNIAAAAYSELQNNNNHDNNDRSVSKKIVVYLYLSDPRVEEGLHVVLVLFIEKRPIWR